MAAPKTYRAKAALYVDERFIREGEIFTTAAPAGSAWEEVKAKPTGGEDAEQTSDPLDHDGDGRKGGSRKRTAPADGADD